MELCEYICAFIAIIIAMLIALYVWTDWVSPLLKKNGFCMGILGNAAGYGCAGLWGNEKNPWNTFN